jgi:glutamate-ammonia-ligase adenylyltransferase
MLEEYLARQGREWERFAWLKGRVISGPVMAGAADFDRQRGSLEACVLPFVFRRYLDFNAIGALRDLHAKIRRETGRRAGGVIETRHHVKLGRGGIREIEFIAQTFQVMRGGRQASLRSRSTLATLGTLGALGVLDAAESGVLAGCYVFLRRLEHALQYVDDAQTHLIPAAPADRDRVARLLGLPGGEDLMARYGDASARVADCFDRIFSSPSRQAVAIEGGAADWTQRLAGLGLADPGAAARRAAALLDSPRVAAGSETGRVRLAHLVLNALPALKEAAEQARARAGAGIDEIFARWLQLLEVIAGRSTYAALLDEYPRALARVVRLLGAGRWPSEYLARHPVLLDELLDERAAGEPFGGERRRIWAQRVDADLRQAGEDAERLMNVLRDAHHAQVFRLLLADLDGRLGVEALADELSALADATLDLSLAALWRLQRGAQAAPPRLAVVGYGKLGGKELGYASDLDLIFVYDDPDPEAPALYAQLVRRWVSWLSTPTSSGVLFDIDLRLRPNGNAGLLVSSFDAFERYQLAADGRGAWTWEHQALTRARACAGDTALARRIEALRRHVLSLAREPAALAADVLAMRARMLQGHPNPGPLFDLKHDRGGMVDIEFAVQYLVLAHASRCPALLDNLGNIALLRIAAELDLVDAESAQASIQAYRHYRLLQHGLRLDGAPFARIGYEPVAGHVAAVLALWRRVFGTDAPASHRPG